MHFSARWTRILHFPRPGCGAARLFLGDEDQGIADMKQAIAISPNRASSKLMGLHRCGHQPIANRVKLW
jgi:hypothetical protein